jgi:hypothetical protein
MNSESVSTWKRTLEIQGFGRSAENVPTEVASRLLQKWLERCQANQMMKK